MPLYEYECNECSHRFERIQKFSDDLVTTCPSCGGKVRKLVSSPAIQFKGTGWYITDYARKPSGEQPASSDGSETSEKSSKDEKPAKADKKTKDGSDAKSASTESSKKPASSSASSSSK